jgi:hypothetical protein
MKKLCHLDLQKPNGKYLRDQRLSSWAKQKFGLTASVKDGFDTREVTPSNSPSSVRFHDICQSEETIFNDKQDLMKFCQYHNCSGFCMKKDQHKK